LSRLSAQLLGFFFETGNCEAKGPTAKFIEIEIKFADCTREEERTTYLHNSKKTKSTK
jgi:hypothetical protein